MIMYLLDVSRLKWKPCWMSIDDCPRFSQLPWKGWNSQRIWREIFQWIPEMFSSRFNRWAKFCHHIYSSKWVELQPCKIWWRQWRARNKCTPVSITILYESGWVPGPGWCLWRFCSLQVAYPPDWNYEVHKDANDCDGIGNVDPRLLNSGRMIGTK